MILSTREQFTQCLEQREDGQYIAHYKSLTLSSVYQPIYTKQTSMVGLEALLRITRKDGSSVRPDLFFSSDNIPLDDKVNVERLSRVIHIRNFAQSKFRDRKLFLNILPVVGDAMAVIDMTESLLATRIKELGLSLDQIVIEVVEHEHANEDLLKTAMKKLSEIGFHIAVDDYGVEASNRARVETLSPDIVKMDRSLMLDYMQGNQAAMISGIELARTLGCQVVIEGIETQEQLDAMRALDLNMYQGYFLSMPDCVLKLKHS